MNRILYLDIIRIIACVMIIAMHAPIPADNWNSYVLVTDSFLTASGIGLFVMVSGALLLPINIPTKLFLKKRLGKVAAPTLFWTFVYYFAAPWVETVSRGSGLTSFLSIPFSVQFNGVLWFMYMLVGLYLIAPILSAWLNRAGKREVEFYLLLWLVTMCYPIIRNFIAVQENKTGILYYLGGYAGYFLLGYYLKRYCTGFSYLLLVPLFVIPLGTASLFKIYAISVDFFDLFWYMSIFVAMMCVGWFLLIRHFAPQYKVSSRIHKAIVMISNCCFGIYLSHILIMRGILWHWDWLCNIEGITQIIVTTILTLLGGFLLTWIISYLPGAAYLIGFKQKR